jgi:hypothetical protein
MRKTLTTAALLLALCCVSFAGEMHTPGAPAPPPEPTPTSAVQEPTGGETLNGEISTPGVSDSLTEVALELLAVLPSLF